MDLTGEFRGGLRPRRLTALALAFCLGCVGPTRIRTALQSPPLRPSASAAEPSPSYTLSSPDVIDVLFANRPSLSGRYSIDADGAVGIAGLGRISVDGLTPGDAEMRLAAAAGMAAKRVHVTVAEHNSRVVFLFGPGVGQERAVPYRGAEPVTGFLRRTSGLASQAKVDEVSVVRPNVAAGRRPEVFDVDLEAILIRGEDRTNVVLEPGDQEYVGATRRSIWARYLPGGDWADKSAIPPH